MQWFTVDETGRLVRHEGMSKFYIYTLNLNLRRGEVSSSSDTRRTQSTQAEAMEGQLCESLWVDQPDLWPEHLRRDRATACNLKAVLSSHTDPHAQVNTDTTTFWTNWHSCYHYMFSLVSILVLQCSNTHTYNIKKEWKLTLKWSEMCSRMAETVTWPRTLTVDFAYTSLSKDRE